MALLIANLVQKLQQQPTSDVAGRPFVPTRLAAEALASLKLPNGESPPPELVAWLAFDASWFRRDEGGALQVETVREILQRWARAMAPEASDEPPPSGPAHWSDDDMVRAWIALLPRPELANAPAIEVTYVPGSQEHVLVLEKNAVRVLGCDKRFEFWWAFDSLAALVTHWLGVR